MNRFFKYFFWATLLGTLTSCGLYRSSDRDNFDSNALAGAPKKTALKPFSTICKSENSLSPSDIPDSVLIEPQADSVFKVTYTMQMHRLAATCVFEYATDASRDELSKESRALVEQYLNGNLDSL